MSEERDGPGIRDVIAERIFQRADGQDVRAIVGRPHEAERPHEAGSVWACEFQIIGIGHDEVYSLSGGDSLEALQLALGMMVVQVESYQRDCGLTLMGDEQLGLMKPDFEAIKKEIAASPHYEQARAVLDEWDCARAFLQDGSPGSRLD
jgi:hypothetical protein